MSSIRPRVLILCLCAVFALLAESAFATHFRYGYMFWERDLNYPVAGMARVLVTVDFGGRWTYPAYTSVLPPPGFTPAPRCTAGAGACCAGVVTTSSDLGTQSCPNLNTLITVSNSPGELIGVRNTGGPMTITDFWGNVLNPVTFSTGSDTNMPGIPMSMLTNQILPTLDTFYARKQFYVIFNPATTTINVVWNGNARISQLLDANNDRLWRMSTFIDLRDPRVTRSPISTSTPIIPVFTNQQNVVMLPGTSFDNLATKFRLAATTESNLVNAFPAPPSEFSLNPNTGQVTFRPRMNGFYAVQFIITAYDPVTLQEKASIPLDVMFQAVIGSSTTSALTVSSPSTSSPPPYQAEANVPFSYSVQAVTTPPNAAYTVTISSTSAAPAGGFFAGGTCAANAPCTKTFNWTPTVNSTPSVICYTATVTNGPTLVTQSPQLCVQVNLSALATTLEALPASGAAGGGPITLSAKLTRTLDNSPLANRPVSFTFESDPNNPPWVKTTSVLGTDTVLTNAQGVATLVVTSTRAVPTPAPYRATFNAIAGELLASSSAVNVISTKQASTSLNAPVVQSNPLPTVGFPLSASAVLNRVFTDGGPFAVAQDGVVFTLTQPGGVTSQVAGSTTSTTGVSTATFPAPTSKGSYSMSAFFPGNDALIGPTQSSSTPFPVFERTQLSIPTTTATVNVPTLVQVTLKTLPGNVPMAFSTVNLQGSFGSRLLTLDANGNATTSVTFTSPGTQVVTASYSPTAGFTNRVGQLAIETDTQVINVAAPQVTLMTVAPVATVAGSPTTFTAKLTDGGGAPIEGATIDFVVILGASLGSAQTGPDGVATISTVAGPSFNGGYRAVFNGMPGYQSTAANATYSVTPAGSSLSVINAPASAVVGQALAVEAQLMRTSAIAGPVAGATIAVTLDQSPAPVTVTGVTDGDGRVTVVFPPLVGRGNKTLSAAFLGDTYLTPATSSSSTLGVFQNIQLTVTPVTGFAGASIGLVASAVTLPDLAPVTEPLPVTFQADQYSAVSTLNNGTAFASVTITSAGTFSLTASTPAQNFFREATSNTETILVNKAESFLTPLTVPAMNLVGGTLNVSTTLSRSTPPAGPLMGAPVSFTLTGPAQFETSVTTEASGVAFAALPLTARGSFNLSAEYAGSPILKSTSRSATVDVFERTKITVLPNPGATAATPTSVSALLVAVPSNSPIAGQTVVFTTTAAGVGPATAVTDANGIATVQLTFAQASPFSVSASFDGASDHFANSLGAAAPEFDSGLITVLPLAATLSPLSVPSTTLVGNSVAASTTLTRADNSMPIEGQSITFSFTSPSGLTTQVMGVTDASGVATATFSTTERGLHSASAAFGGNTAVLPMTSPTAGISAYQPVALTLTAPPSSIAGQNVVFTASLRTIPGNAPVAGQTVSFASSLSSGTAVTDAAGNAMFTVATDNAGDVDVEASFSNTAAYFADAAGNQVASTASASVTVAKATTSLSSIAVNPNALVAGTITASAALTRTSAPVGAIAGAPVAFVITAPSGATLNASAQTNEAGVATITFAAAERGIYAISASFAGTTALTESSAAPANTTAYQRTQLTATGAASANAGAPLTLSATLATVPGGAPLAGQTITFDFGGVIAPLNAVTDAFGIASVTIVAPSAGWIDANASFMNAAAFYTNNSGAIPPAPETATTGVTINEAATVLAAIVAPANTTTNSAVTASTVLTRVDGLGIGAGEAITFTLTKPDGSLAQTLTATTEAMGAASVTFSGASTTLRGLYMINASYAGNTALAPVSAATSPVTVYQPTTLSIAPVSGIAGEPVTISATLESIPPSVVMANESITFTFNGATHQATTNGAGIATVNVIAPISGSFDVDASFENGGAFFTNSAGAIPPAATTASSVISVVRASTELSNVVAPAGGTVAGSVSLSATLQRHFSDGAHAAPAGAIVKFTVTGPSGTSEVMGTTDAAGNATASFTPTVRGVHSVSASFDTNDAMAGSASPAASSFTAYQRTSLSVADASGTAAKPVTISATLTDVPGGAPIAGANVGFQFSGPSAPAGPLFATTNASGVASITTTFPSVAVYSVTATYLNVPGFYTNEAGAIPPSPTGATADVNVTNNAPTFITPASITAEATGPTGRVVSYSPMGDDVEDGAITAVCTPASPTTFPLGTTTINCTVTDTAGATASGSFTVTIEDTTAPSLTLPANITTDPTGPTGAPVSFTATATDIVTFPISPVCSPVSGSTFVIGTTTVNCSATDAAGNSQSGTFTVTVRNPTQAAQNLQQVAADAGMTQGDNNIDNVMKFLNKQNGGSLNAACNNLNSVIKKAEKLPSAQGAPVIAAALNLKATIGCTP